MKKLLWIAVLAIACSKAPSEKVLAPAAFESNYKNTTNAILLDVRTEEEVANGKIAEAKNIVYDDAFATKLDSLPKQPLFVYCGSALRIGKQPASRSISKPFTHFF
jgi:hypothetical protein